MIPFRIYAPAETIQTHALYPSVAAIKEKLDVDHSFYEKDSYDTTVFHICFASFSTS